MIQNNFKISVRIAEKINKKHNITIEEIWECFLNRTQGLLEDTRLDHQTDPPTLWFIAETAYELNNNKVKIYDRYA